MAMQHLAELAGVFLKLGLIGFGGPAAHIAMLQAEVVDRRGWLTRDEFVDLLGATNLIPGPNSTEMAIHVGYRRAGLPGLVVAGVCFILPAVLLTAAIAWSYVTFGTVPQVAPLLVGIKPAVLAIILMALSKLGRTALKSRALAVLGAAVAVAVLLGLNEIAALLAGALLGMLWLRWRHDAAPPAAALLAGPAKAQGVAGAAAASALTLAPSLPDLFWFFLKIGAVLYGSGYVLIAFLQGGLVERYGWLTQQQLLDAIAIGQFTPGPVLSTATFIGYVINGAPGAAVATLGIFLPSFVFVALVNPLVPKLRRSPWMGRFLDAVNAAAIGLMAAVTVELGRQVLVTWPALLIFAVAVGVVWRWPKVNAAWVVVGGAVAGSALERVA